MKAKYIPALARQVTAPHPPSTGVPYVSGEKFSFCFLSEAQAIEMAQAHGKPVVARVRGTRRVFQANVDGTTTFLYTVKL